MYCLGRDEVDGPSVIRSVPGYGAVETNLRVSSRPLLLRLFAP